jgi:clan AA aspartic protease
MINGVVNVHCEGTIRLTVKGPDAQEQQLEAIVDTGFTGSLTLPPAIIAALGLVWRMRGSAILANGSIDEFDVYAANLIWDEVPRNVLVESADTEPLIGLRLMRGYSLHMEVVDGGSVVIESLP